MEASMKQIRAPEYRDPPRVTDEAATLSPNESRQAVKIGPMRYVLGISTAAVIVAFVVAYFLVR
jgi:hypothetical protein